MPSTQPYNQGQVVEPVVRMAEVPGECERLGIQCEVLEKSIGELELRLQPVLAQHKVAGENSQSQPEPIRVPLAEVLHSKVLYLEKLISTVQSMTSRLEL